MDMRMIKREKRLCTCCMEEHEVKTVLVTEEATFKNVNVRYVATYQYCDAADELSMDEQQMHENTVRLREAYRKAEGFLTSAEIDPAD